MSAQRATKRWNAQRAASRACDELAAAAEILREAGDHDLAQVALAAVARLEHELRDAISARRSQ